MIQSLFILSPVGEVLIERHFRGVATSRSVCDIFWDRASLSVNHHGGVSSATTTGSWAHYDTVPPVMEVPESEQGTLYVISILRDGLSYLAVCPAEVSPLLIIELLHRLANIFVEYFGDPADESAIKDNFSTVYQLTEEMVDYGWPLTTEPNALKAMIRPPTVMSKLLQTPTTVSDGLPSGTVSNMPWRASGVNYTQNEIYMDIVEEIDAIVDSSGAMVSCDVSGSIFCQSHLSGIPDLLLTFKEPELIDDCSFHPCVRYALFEKDQVVSFVPPDGDFTLMRYRIKPSQVRNFRPPIYCHAQYVPPSGMNTSASHNTSHPSDAAAINPTGRLVLQVGMTTVSSLIFSASRRVGPYQVEEVTVTIPFPKQTKSTTDFQVNLGTVQFDEAAKVARWTLGNLDATKKATFSCSFTMNLKRKKTLAPLGGAGSSGGGGDADDDDQMGLYSSDSTALPNLSLGWTIPLASVSGLQVSGLSVTGETYRPYKGVRNITRSGRFQVRCR